MKIQDHSGKKFIVPVAKDDGLELNDFVVHVGDCHRCGEKSVVVLGSDNHEEWFNYVDIAPLMNLCEVCIVELLREGKALLNSEKTEKC